MKLHFIAGAAALMFSVTSLPATAQSAPPVGQQEDKVVPCTGEVFRQAISAMEPAAVEAQLVNIYQAGQASGWQSAALVYNNHITNLANNERWCKGTDVNIVSDIVAYAGVADKPLPVSESQMVEAEAAAAAAEAEMSQVQAEIGASEDHLSTLERAQAREPNNGFLKQQVAAVANRVTNLEQRRTQLRDDIARRDWVSKNFVSQTDYDARFDPTSDSFFMKDEGMAEALRAQLTNPELGDNALVTKGDLDSAIAGIEHPEANAIVAAAAERSWWQWLMIGLLALGTTLGVIGFVRSLRSQPEGLSQSQADNIKKAMERSTTAKNKVELIEKDLGTKAIGKDVAALENRVASIESRYKHTVEKIAVGDQKTLLPADINKLKKGDTFTYHLMVDGEHESFKAEVVDQADSGNAVVKLDDYQKTIVSKKLFGTLAGYIEQRKVD